MKADVVLDRACQLVTGDRALQNGAMRENHTNIANLWNAYLFDGDSRLTPKDVALMMLLLKVARTQAGAGVDDNFIDAAGYAGIAGELSDDE